MEACVEACVCVEVISGHWESNSKKEVIVEEEGRWAHGTQRHANVTNTLHASERNTQNTKATTHSDGEMAAR